VNCVIRNLCLLAKCLIYIIPVVLVSVFSIRYSVDESFRSFPGETFSFSDSTFENFLKDTFSPSRL
jgi:hypothetical protein